MFLRNRAHLLCVGLWSVSLHLLIGCGGASQATTPAQTTAEPRQPIVSEVSDTNYKAALRSYFHLHLDDPRRDALRERLVAYLAEQGRQRLEAGDYDGVVESFAAITELYRPEELAPRRLSPDVAPLALFLVEKGAPSGDEARVLSGLLALHLLHPNESSYEDRYQRLKQWGRESRGTLSGPLEPYMGLVEVWEEHARLTPAPSVLDALTQVYVDRRDALIAFLESDERGGRFNPMALRGLRTTALDVAAVYLAENDISSALGRVEAISGGSSLESRLIEVLRTARKGGDEAADAKLELARLYLENGQTRVALALCRNGLRNHREDPRFPQYLALVAARGGDYADATAWYAEAIERAPGEQALYDEALEVLSQLIEGELYEADPSGTRELAEQATRILKARRKHWPDAVSPIAMHQLHLAIGIAEMNGGNAEEAEQRLKASLELKPTVRAMLQLGMLLERTGRPGDGLKHYRAALKKLDPDASEASDRARAAEVHEHLGDAHRRLGHAEKTREHYEEAIALWKATLPLLEEEALAHAHVRMGVLLDRVDRSEEALDAWRTGMEAAPTDASTYKAVVSHLVVTEPRLDLAYELFRRATRQMSLEPEWKVYLALWVQIVARRAGEPVPPEIEHVLVDLAEGSEWWGRLAAFGAGQLSYRKLLAQAEGIGQRTEAQFYEAARRLYTSQPTVPSDETSREPEGDLDDGRELLQQVLDNKMVNFYEHTMALELLASERPSAEGGADTASADNAPTAE